MQTGISCGAIPQNITTNAANRFFIVNDNHFPPTNRYHKILNKNKVEVSYHYILNTGHKYLAIAKNKNAAAKDMQLQIL